MRGGKQSMKGSRLSDYNTLKLVEKGLPLTKQLIWREAEEEDR